MTTGNPEMGDAATALGASMEETKPHDHVVVSQAIFVISPQLSYADVAP